MTRPTLLRRAAAATIGVDQRPSHARALPLAPGLTLARQAAAAVIGIRAYRLPATATPGALAQGAEVEGVGGSAPSALPPLVTLGSPGRPSARERPRRGLVLATAAAVMAIATAIGAYVYHEDLSVEEQPPAHNRAGVLPEKYLGTWKGAIENDLGHNTRTMVIRQGYAGETVMTLTADGPKVTGDAYHCVFKAQLDSVTIGAIRLSESTVASAKPPTECKPGRASTLTLVGEDKLHRANDDGSDRGLTYTRTQ